MNISFKPQNISEKYIGSYKFESSSLFQREWRFDKRESLKEVEMEREYDRTIVGNIK